MRLRGGARTTRQRRHHHPTRQEESRGADALFEQSTSISAQVEHESARAAHYPSIKPELVELTSALHELAHDSDKRAQYMADAAAYADRFTLPPDQREALIKLDLPGIVKMGAHPLVPFLAQLQIQRLRPRQ